MVFEDSDVIDGQEEFNKNLINKGLTLNDLKVYLKLKYQDVKECGRVVGISETRVRQILIGYNVPKSAKLIRQIATGWGIDEIKLTQLFSRISIPDLRECYEIAKLKEEGEPNRAKPLENHLNSGEVSNEQTASR